MDRKEAIKILENWLSSSRRTEKRLGYINGWFYEEDEEAFRMAIEALNCSEIPTGSNLISRQDAIDAVADGLKGVFVEYRDVAEKLIGKLPSAEPRKGEWMDTTGGQHYKCSVCGCRAGYWFNEENSCEYNMDMSEWLSDFCPNCGADMRGEEE